MKICNQAQNSLKHENHQNNLYFKAYVCLIQTKVYIHIQTQRVHKYICMKARGSMDIHVYLKVWPNRHIHEVKTHDHKTCPKWGIQVKMHDHQK